MGTKMDPAFKQQLESAPVQRYDVIIRVAGDPRDLADRVVQHGLHIQHTYRLIQALSASGLGTAILAVADEPWVVKIEPDQEMRTMK